MFLRKQNAREKASRRRGQADRAKTLRQDAPEPQVLLINRPPPTGSSRHAEHRCASTCIPTALASPTPCSHGTSLLRSRSGFVTLSDSSGELAVAHSGRSGPLAQGLCTCSSLCLNPLCPDILLSAPSLSGGFGLSASSALNIMQKIRFPSSVTMPSLPCFIFFKHVLLHEQYIFTHSLSVSHPHQDMRSVRAGLISLLFPAVILEPRTMPAWDRRSRNIEWVSEYKNEWILLQLSLTEHYVIIM